MKEEEKVTSDRKFTADYKNGKSTITVVYEGVSNVFPVVMYSEKAMEKVREAQQQLNNERQAVTPS
jgi:predicted RND superfamily exporter protein